MNCFALSDYRSWSYIHAWLQVSESDDEEEKAPPSAAEISRAFALTRQYMTWMSWASSEDFAAADRFAKLSAEHAMRSRKQARIDSFFRPVPRAAAQADKDDDDEQMSM